MTTVERKRLEQKWNDVSIHDPVPHVRLRGYRILRKYKPLNPSINSNPVEGGLRCLCCDDRIDYITSTPGKVMTGMGSRVDVRSTMKGGVLVDVETVLGFPIMKTGRACKECKGKLKVVLYDEGLE